MLTCLNNAFCTIELLGLTTLLVAGCTAGPSAGRVLRAIVAIMVTVLVAG
jgi:hypothetical protein